MLVGAAWATNLLIVVADDLGADKVAAFSEGGRWLPSTPALDSLSTAGLSFTDAWAQPVCSPTRATLLTGDHPFHHGVGAALSSTRDTALSESTQTLAETLRDAGWATAVFGKWHLGFAGSEGRVDWSTTEDCDTGFTSFTDAASPLRHGFDRWVGPIEGDDDQYDRWLRVESETTTTSCMSTEWPDTAFVTEAADWIGSQAGPWFVLLGLNAAHVDSGGAEGALGYELDDLSATCQAALGAEDACLATGACGDSDGDGTDDAQDRIYAALVSCADSQIGTLLDAIDPAVLDDTWIVFLGDNGTPGRTGANEEVMEPPYDASVDPRTGDPIYGKGTNFRSGVRVPFVLAHGADLAAVRQGDAPPGLLVQAPGRTVDQQVLVADVYDTACSLLGVEGVDLDGDGVQGDDTDGADFSPCTTSVGPVCAEDLLFRAAWAETFVSTSTGAIRTAFGVYERGGDRVTVSYDRTEGCLYPALYTDPWDADDVWDDRGPVSHAMLASALRRLDASWFPTEEDGSIVWCR